MKRTLAFLGILALLLTITAFGPAPAAIAALNGKSIKGRNITVNEARPRTDSRGGGSGGGFSRRY